MPQPPRPALTLVVLHGVLACRASTSTGSNATAPPRPSTIAAAASPTGEVLVRARQAPEMPVCEATDAITTASLSPGVPAHPALARRGDEGLVAFVTAPRAGETRLALLPLGAQASPTDEHGNLRDQIELTDTGPMPAFPALVPYGEGYLLAWREGVRTRQRMMVRRLDARGVPQGAAWTVGETGVLGAPSLFVDAERWTVAFARADTLLPDAGRSQGVPWATHLVVATGDHPPHVVTVTAPNGARFDGSPPVFVSTPAGLRVQVTVARRDAVPGDERALLQLLDADGPTLVARDLDHPTALSTPQGPIMAWRARMTRHDTALRAVRIPFGAHPDRPPVTLATYRGAFELTPALAPLGHGRIGVFSISTLSDDAAGSLNVSLLDESGAYIGRAPVLTSFPARSATMAVAPAPPGSSDPMAWLAIDGRATDGSGPKLLLVRAGCDPSRTVDRLDVPPGTFLQDLSPPEPPPLGLARNAPEHRCVVRNHGDFTPHRSNTDDVLVGSSAGVAVTRTQASLFTVARSHPGTPPKLLSITLDAQHRPSPLRTLFDDASEVLAAEAIPGETALAVVPRVVRGVVRPFVVIVRNQTIVVRPFAQAWRDPSSAAIVRETGAIVMVARDDTGATVLVYTPWGADGPGPSRAVAWLRRGDAIADVARRERATEVLLSRPDGMGGDVGRSVAAWTIRDGEGSASEARDPFADPLGHPRRTTLWHTIAGVSALVYDENALLRVAEVRDGMLHAPRSVLELFPGGGAVRSSAWAGAGLRWLALATGFPDEAHAAMRDVTLAALDDRGEIRALSTTLPNDDDALATGIALGAYGERVVFLYPRTERGGGMRWVWIDATCPLPGGLR